MNVTFAVLESHLFDFQVCNIIIDGAPLREILILYNIAQLNLLRFIHSKAAVTSPLPIERALKTCIGGSDILCDMNSVCWLIPICMKNPKIPDGDLRNSFFFVRERRTFA